MSKLINSATYQGYPVKSVVWKRSDGLTAEYGSVVVDYSVLKDLKLEAPLLPWTGDDGGADIPGGLVISAWWELFGKRPGSRAEHKPVKEPKEGLSVSGRLILTTEDDGKKESVQYDEVFMLNAEEISENIAEVLEHKEGEIRIDLTDIRFFNPRYGVIIGRINCRLENGKYDPKTIKKPGRVVVAGQTVTSGEVDGEPWPFKDVIQYLFSQLPGGPTVSFQPPELPNKLPPPEEIDHIGSNAASVLQGVLDNYGLIPKLQPNGTYLVCRRNDENFVKPGEVPNAPNKKKKADHLAYQKKSVNRIDTPACVQVLGGRQVQQETIAYVPVFKDLDGRTYLLSDIEKVWDGYDIWKVNRQAAKTPNKYFHDVPPAPINEEFTPEQLESIIRGGKGITGFAHGRQQDDLHFARRATLREQAYRMYAPIGLFSNAPTNLKGAPFFTDEDERTFSFLPMGKVPLLESQIGEPVPGAKKIKGDQGRIVLTPPVVRGTTLGESIFTDVSQIIRAYDAVLHGLVINLNYHNLCLFLIESRLKTLDDDKTRADQLTSEGQTFKEKLVTKFAFTPQAGENIRISHDLIKKANKILQARSVKEGELKIQLDVAKSMKLNVEQEIARLKVQRGNDITKLAIVGGLKGTGQLPWGVVPSSNYNLDTATGILTFTKDVCCTVDRPVVFDRDQLTVYGDGIVSVTFGHQIDDNATSDFTSIIFSRDGRGTAQLRGANRPTAVKAYVVRDPDLVMYLAGDGEPMNLKDCIDQARKKASPLLDGPDVLEGHVDQLDGFVPAVLTTGVQSIQYVWPAKSPVGGTAYTYIATHSPMWAGPVGRGQTTKLIDSDGPARTAAKQVEDS